MSSSLKQCTITSEKSHTQIWRERLSIFKRTYCSPMKNAAKFSFDNFITSFCKMVAVATEICVKGLYLCCTPQSVAGCLFAFPFHVGSDQPYRTKPLSLPIPFPPLLFFLGLAGAWIFLFAQDNEGAADLLKATMRTKSYIQL